MAKKKPKLIISKEDILNALKENPELMTDIIGSLSETEVEETKSNNVIDMTEGKQKNTNPGVVDLTNGGKLNRNIMASSKVATISSFEPPKKMTFYDNPKECVKEGEWDKARNKKHKFIASERVREPVQYYRLRCALCNRIYQISGGLFALFDYKAESYRCNGCSR